MPQMGRHAGGTRSQNLLETFTHGVADRSTGFVIERFDVFVWIFHGSLRNPDDLSDQATAYQVSGVEFVSAYRWVPAVLANFR
jgi:hypothetical protein